MIRKFNFCFQVSLNLKKAAKLQQHVIFKLGQRADRFSQPSVDEITVVMVGDLVENRKIKITKQISTVRSITNLYRLYDALQYPKHYFTLMFHGTLHGANQVKNGS